MFRRRLQIALATLAAAALLQGAVAWWAIDVMSVNVLRGRVASDVLTGFLDLSATKQRLRAWLSQAVWAGSADTQTRDALLADLAVTIVRLRSLSDRAIALADGGGEDSAEIRQRMEALSVLTRSLDELRVGVKDLPSLPAPPSGVAANAAAWTQIQRIFDVSQDQDLRTLMASNIAREQLAVARERAAADRSLSLVRGMAFGTTLALALAAVALALHFAGALRRPLDALRRGTEALQHGDLQHRIPDIGADEFGQLARTVNALAGELERHRQGEAEARLRLEGMVQARTAELQQALHTGQLVDARRRQLFADISHELRTPTTAIRGEAEITLRGRDKPLEEYRTALARIADASRHLGSVIDDLLAIARQDLDALALRREPLAIGPVLAEAVNQAGALARERRITLALEDATAVAPGAEVRLQGDVQRLRQLFLLLLDNAVAYSHPGGHVEVRARADDRSWQLEVIDQGIGIAADELPQVFERRYRSAGARAHRPDGSGLGLPMARALVEAHGGTITLSSAESAGTCVQVSLPRPQPAGAGLPPHWDAA